MSLRRGNRREAEIELESIIHFLKVIFCMAAGITALALIGMLASAAAGKDTLLYQMTLAVDGILLLGGALGLRILNRREKGLKERTEADAG